MQISGNVTVAGLNAADRRSLTPTERVEMKRDLCGMRICVGRCQLFESLQFQPRKGIVKNIVHTRDMLCFKTNVIFQTNKHQPTY